MIAFIIVVFPTPFIPIKQVISPFSAVKEIPSNTFFLPNFFVTSFTSITQIPPIHSFSFHTHPSQDPRLLVKAH